jgi:hypothetical protein
LIFYNDDNYVLKFKIIDGVKEYIESMELEQFTCINCSALENPLAFPKSRVMNQQSLVNSRQSTVESPESEIIKKSISNWERIDIQ